MNEYLQVVINVLPYVIVAMLLTWTALAICSKIENRIRDLERSEVDRVRHLNRLDNDTTRRLVNHMDEIDKLNQRAMVVNAELKSNSSYMSDLEDRIEKLETVEKGRRASYIEDLKTTPINFEKLSCTFCGEPALWFHRKTLVRACDECRDEAEKMGS